MPYVINPHVDNAPVFSIIRPKARAAFQDDQPMIFYEIPYEQGNTDTWHLDGLAVGRKSFDSRVAALSFAIQAAKAVAKDLGDQACIAIQGADGTWRTFDPDMVPLK